MRFLEYRDSVMLQMDNLLDNFFNSAFEADGLLSLQSKTAYPKVNVFEDGKYYVVKATVTGLTKEDIDVEITRDNVLKISGKSVADKRTYRLREIHTGSFERLLKLPEILRGVTPEAMCVEGLLTLTWEVPGKTPLENKKIEIY